MHEAETIRIMGRWQGQGITVQSTAAAKPFRASRIPGCELNSVIFARMSPWAIDHTRCGPMLLLTCLAAHRMCIAHGATAPVPLL